MNGLHLPQPPSIATVNVQSALYVTANVTVVENSDGVVVVGVVAAAAAAPRIPAAASAQKRFVLARDTPLNLARPC